MRRYRLSTCLILALLASCGGPRTPTGLDDIAAKPDEVKAKLKQAEAAEADRLKRADPDAPPPADGAEPQR